MVFFNSKTNQNGRESLVVGQQWWLFPVITIPLTILVFTVWVLWQRHRNRSHSGTFGVDENTDAENTVPLVEKEP